MDEFLWVTVLCFNQMKRMKLKSKINESNIRFVLIILDLRIFIRLVYGQYVFSFEEIKRKTKFQICLGIIETRFCSVAMVSRLTLDLKSLFFSFRFTQKKTKLD
jgi:hypothetical protein